MTACIAVRPVGSGEDPSPDERQLLGDAADDPKVLAAFRFGWSAANVSVYTGHWLPELSSKFRHAG